MGACTALDCPIRLCFSLHYYKSSIHQKLFAVNAVLKFYLAWRASGCRNLRRCKVDMSPSRALCHVERALRVSVFGVDHEGSAKGLRRMVVVSKFLP